VSTGPQQDQSLRLSLAQRWPGTIVQFGARDAFGSPGPSGAGRGRRRCCVVRSLWGSRSRPVPLTWVISVLGRLGMIVSRVLASALPDLPPAGEPAVVAWPLIGVQGRRTPGAAPRSRRAAQSQAPSPAWTGRIEPCSPRSSGGCHRYRGGTAWSRRARSCAGTGA
jgi:hypothetical protein